MSIDINIRITPVLVGARYCENSNCNAYTLQATPSSVKNFNAKWRLWMSSWAPRTPDLTAKMDKQLDKINKRHANGFAAYFACDKHKEDIEYNLTLLMEPIVPSKVEFTVGHKLFFKASRTFGTVTEINGDKLKFVLNGVESDFVNWDDIKSDVKVMNV